MEKETLIGRRGFFRLGALAALATAASPLLGRELAWATPEPEVCNPDAPETPAAALQALMTGNAAWAAGDPQRPGQDAERRACLADNPQTPFASILSCSDSRCSPELLFDQGLGDIFVARVAGNTASGRLIDSLLFGTENLGSVLLFVLGHTACGAVIAAVDSYPFPNLRLPFVDLIFPAVKSARKLVPNWRTNRNELIRVTTIENVKITRQELKNHFNLSSSQVAGGVYDLGTQKVTLV